MTNIEFDGNIVQFGFGTKLEKRKFLTENPDKKIYMDLTCFDPQEFYNDFPQLKGSFAALFCDETKKMEIHFQEKNQIVLDKLTSLGFSPVETSIVSCGFIFPRTIVQIINEGYFALEEKVASQEDIDRAMKFGVNYPKGPFEWAKGREYVVLALLEELRAKTGDERYRPSSMLKNRAH